MPKRSMTFKADRSFEKKQSVEPTTKRYMGDVAQHVADRAVASMPSGFMGERSKVRATSDGEVHAGPGWHLIEFGTQTTSPRAPFRRAVESLGMKLEDSR
jgi:hypothetical protein